MHYFDSKTVRYVTAGALLLSTLVIGINAYTTLNYMSQIDLKEKLVSAEFIQGNDLENL